MPRECTHLVRHASPLGALGGHDGQPERERGCERGARRALRELREHPAEGRDASERHTPLRKGEHVREALPVNVPRRLRRVPAGRALKH
jgi:hypothetical protein